MNDSENGGMPIPEQKIMRGHDSCSSTNNPIEIRDPEATIFRESSGMLVKPTSGLKVYRKKIKETEEI